MYYLHCCVITVPVVPVARRNKHIIASRFTQYYTESQLLGDLSGKLNRYIGGLLIPGSLMQTESIQNNNRHGRNISCSQF